MSERLAVRRAIHPEDAEGKDAWVVFDTVRQEICDGAYMIRRDAEAVAKTFNRTPESELWDGPAPACIGVTGWMLALDDDR